MFEKSNQTALIAAASPHERCVWLFTKETFTPKHENTALVFPQTLETRGEKHAAINTVQ